MRKHEQPKMDANTLKCCFAGVAVSMVIMLLLVGVSAVILTRGIIIEKHGRIIQLLNHLLAVLAGCLTANKIETGRTLIITVIVGTVYTLLCATINAMIFNAEYHSVHMTLAAISGGMIIGCLVSGIRTDKVTKKYKRLKL